MVGFRWFLVASCIALVASVTACNRQETAPAKKVIGHHVTRLSVSIGSIWGGGYLVDVAPEEYVIVEHENCPTAKENAPVDIAKGLCAVRITKEQSDRFGAAMERFKRNAVPLESFSIEDPYVRPDGKPCRNQATDSTGATLIWTGTEGAKIATFYLGCDYEEFENFYKSVLAVTDALPIQEIIKSH